MYSVRATPTMREYRTAIWLGCRGRAHDATRGKCVGRVDDGCCGGGRRAAGGSCGAACHRRSAAAVRTVLIGRLHPERVDARRHRTPALIEAVPFELVLAGVPRGSAHGID